MKRLLILSGILLLSCSALAGLREGSSEFELFAGSHLGDTFTLHTDAGDFRMDVKDSTLLGMRGSYFFHENFAVEFTLSGTHSETRAGDDFDMYYYHGNILYQFGHAAFSPFVTVGMGVTTTKRPDPESGGYLENTITDSHFSGNIGGGFKVYFSKDFALRTDVRAYWTAFDKGHCHHDDHDGNNDNCWNNGNLLETTEISAGFVFAF